MKTQHVIYIKRIKCNNVGEFTSNSFKFLWEKEIGNSGILIKLIKVRSFEPQPCLVGRR